MKNKNLNAILYLPYLVLIGLMLFGYVLNIVKLCECDFESKTSCKPEIIHTIGAVTGLGVITGYLDLGK